MEKAPKKILLFSAFLIMALGLTSCDPERRKKCEWTLEYESRTKLKIKDRHVNVCARNRKNNKQDCRFQVNEKVYNSAKNKKFRYVDIEHDSGGIPRTIRRIKYCN